MSEPASEPASVRVDLGPTRQQLAYAFGWAIIGLVIGVGFIVIATASGDPIPGSIAIGGGIAVLALISGVLEYLALPGAQLILDAEQLVIRPRRDDAVVLPLESVGRLQVDPPEVGIGRPLFGRVTGEFEIPGRQPRNPAENRIRDRRPGRGWRLTVHPKQDGLELPGHGRAIEIGMDDARLAALRAACDRFGVLLSAPE